MGMSFGLGELGSIKKMLCAARKIARIIIDAKMNQYRIIFASGRTHLYSVSNSILEVLI